MSSDNRQPTATPGDYTARTRQERLEGLVEHLAIGSCEGDAVLAGDLGALIDEKPAGCSTCKHIATFLDKQNPDIAVVSVSAIRGFLAGEDCGEKGAEEDALAALAASQREVVRLRECLDIAGLQAFMRDADPSTIAHHLRGVADSWLCEEKRLNAELAQLRDLAKQATDDLMAVQGSLEAAGREVARLKDELAKSTQAEVEATNACRVLEADAMRCSRSAEQAKADVERLKDELAYLSDDCPPGECAALEKAKAEVTRLKEELESSQKARDEWMFKRLGEANNQIKLIDAKATILAKEHIDELQAKERQLRDALQAIYEWSFQYVIPREIKMQVCEAISGQPAICPSCCELNDVVAQLKEEGRKGVFVINEYDRRTKKAEDNTKALKDYITYAFHKTARDPARRAYPALIELEKMVATGKFGSAPCPDCKTLRKRVETWAKTAGLYDEDECAILAILHEGAKPRSLCRFCVNDVCIFPNTVYTGCCCQANDTCIRWEAKA